MSNDKSPFDGAEPQPDPSVDYETAGTKVLTEYALDEMTNSVARLKRDLRAAFSAKQSPTGSPSRR